MDDFMAMFQGFSGVLAPKMVISPENGDFSGETKNFESWHDHFPDQHDLFFGPTTPVLDQASTRCIHQSFWAGAFYIGLEHMMENRVPHSSSHPEAERIHHTAE